MALFVMGLFAAFNRSNQPQPGTAQENGDVATGEGIVDVSVEEAYKLIQQHQDEPDFVVLDLRTPPEYASGHLPGAELLNFYDPAFINEIQKLDRNKTYLYYCATGNRSSSVTEIMQHLGFKKAYHVYQGIYTWQLRGLPIE